MSSLCKGNETYVYVLEGKVGEVMLKSEIIVKFNSCIRFNFIL